MLVHARFHAGNSAPRGGGFAFFGWLSAGVVIGVTLVVSCGSGPEKAIADTGGGGGTCAGTCTVQGPLKVVTADTDPAQLKTGSLSKNGSVTVKGPFVLTSLQTALFQNNCVTFAEARNVGETAVLWSIGVTGNEVIVNSSTVVPGVPLEGGARLLVADGQELTIMGCEATWSGFTPY